MFNLPLIFLCNTLFFAFVLEERFKSIPTIIVYAAAYIISLVSNIVISNNLAGNAAEGTISNTVAIFWCLLASVFLSPNNIMQKLLIGLVLSTDYSFFTDFIPNIIVTAGIPISGWLGLLIGNVIYIILTLLVYTLYVRPMHYFYRRRITATIVILCLFQLLDFYVSMGNASSFFDNNSFAFRFSITFIMYFMIVFTVRAMFTAAKYKAKDIIRENNIRFMNAEADIFSGMLANIDAYKNARKDDEYRFTQIAQLASQNKVTEIKEYVSLQQTNEDSSLYQKVISDNPYINAVLITKTSEAKDNGVNLETSVSIGDTRIKVVEMAMIINDLLDDAIDKSRRSDEKNVHLSISASKSSVQLEAVYSIEPIQKEKFSKRTLFSNISSFFEEINDDLSDPYINIRNLIEKYSGKISTSIADKSAITRIEIDY
jgi:hypothetical protein